METHNFTNQLKQEIKNKNVGINCRKIRATTKQ
jgi:hypothetical protein